MKLLVSVRDVPEALAVAEAGVGFIDLKDPGAGALGGLPLPRLREILAALRRRACTAPVSATIGDWPCAPLAPVLAQVAAVAATGVDLVKVGIAPGPDAGPLLRALGHWARQAPAGVALVPVFIAAAPLDPALVALALQQPFPALMADTQDKRGGSLLQRRGAAELRAFVAQVRSWRPDAPACAGFGAAAPAVGLAGALRLDDLPALAALAPDFAGFRSAVCDGDRAGALSPQRLAHLQQAVAAAAGPALSPSA